jgi:hypothetical protein
MATGKTNARWITVDFDDNTPTVRDISTDVLSITGVGLDHETSDVTGYSDGVKNFTLGHPSSEIDLTMVFNNTASTGSHTVFSAVVGDQTTTHTLTVDVGILATPAGGDPQFEGEYYCTSYIFNGDGTTTAHLVPAGSTAPAWGTV